MLKALAETGLNLLILAPLFFLARRSYRSSFYAGVLLYFALVYLINNVLVSSLAIPLFEGQRFNWLGKGAATLFLVLCVYLLPGFRKEPFGLTWRAQWEGTRPILAICAIYFLLRIGLYYFSGEATAAIHLETTLFQATLPGIHEELLYRGVLMGLLSSVLIRPSFRFAGVDFGWPVILTTLLFGLDHAVSISQSFDVNVNYFGLVRTGIDGFLFALLVQKTRSLFPAVVYHNLLNLIGNH
jgi:membrane protease YdiL (CAAX protease family)